MLVKHLAEKYRVVSSKPKIDNEVYTKIKKLAEETNSSQASQFPEDDDDRWYLIQAHDDDDDEFQEYVFEDGRRVPQDHDVGIELLSPNGKMELVLFKDIQFHV